MNSSALKAGPPETTRRLDALRQYAVLDTEPEQALDDLTKLAATICEAPISLIALVDQDRQWFKSRFGLTTTEAPLEVSICVHAIQQRDLFVVPDATRDERFAENPFVLGETGLRFYAGAPLVTPEDVVIGTLCVIDRVPRTLTPIQEEALRVLGRQVMTHLELRRHARELVESEDIFEKAFRLSPDGVTIVRLADRTILKANEAICRILGSTAAEIIGKPSVKFSRWLDEKERAIFLQTLEETGECLDFEMNLLGAGGALLLLNSSSRLLTLNGESCILTVMRDVTAERHTAHALVASELRYRRLFESAKDGILILDAETGMVVDANPFMISLLGFSHSEFLGKAIWELGVFRDLLANEAKFTELREKEYVRYESLPLETRDGQRIEVEFVSNVYLVSGSKVIQCNVRDITERRRTEEALRSSEERFRGLFEGTHDAITTLEPPGWQFTSGNPAAVKMFGAKNLEEFLALGPLDASPEQQPDGRASSEKATEVVARSMREGSLLFEWMHRRIGGEDFPAEVLLTRVGRPGKEMLYATVRDITERKRSEARFRRLVDSNAQGVMFWNTKGEITGANDAFLRLVGYTREDLKDGRITWKTITPPEFADLDRRALAEISACGVCTPYEKEYLRKDHSRVCVLAGAATFEDTREEGICFALDLTERKKLEQQFLRAQRMEGIGTLAGGIAHDLNNVLSPILLSLELLKAQFTDSGSQELLAILETSAQRGADLVRQVLSFARGVEGSRVEVQVRHLVQEIAKIANDTFLKHIRVLTVVPSSLWTVMGDPTQLHQVLLNLCVNARDAMPDGGTLTISAENLTLDAQYAGMSVNPDARPGAYIFIQVRDTGTGIPAGVIEKIFDPFFTTKELGKGTGLGLSTTLGIIKSLGGFIRVYSEIGKGTSFNVYLPAQTEVSTDAAAQAAAELPRGHGELVLVVDDEAAVCQVTQRTLEAFGYSVILAANGVEALSVYATHRAEIAVVLTDMMMPIMDGPATMRVLREMNPGVLIIAASGLAGSDHTAQAKKLGVKLFLSKPYTAETLLKALKETLSS